MAKFVRIVFFFVPVALFISCNNDPLKSVDVSDSQIKFVSHRFDNELFGTDFTTGIATSQLLYHKYGTFLCDYMEVILQLAPCMPDSNILYLADFVNHPDMASLQNQVKTVYSESVITKLDTEFEDALKRWHHFFPDSVVPSIVYMNSGLNYSAFSSDSTLAIGLDFFLGADDSIVKMLPTDLFPQYLKDDMKMEYVVVNGIRDFCWCQCSAHDNTSEKTDLLSLLVHQGKVMYLLDALIPFSEDSLKMNWTVAQQKWMDDNQYSVWQEMAKQEVLFGTDISLNRKWIDFAPFTSAADLPQDSPPQVGIWMGWQMVRAYMKDHPEFTINELLKEQNAQKILASYKPKR